MVHADHHEHQHGANTVCPSCDIGPFSRNNYFTGKLMLERDFTDETRYHIDKLRHHHQRLHGWGVVCGLKVKQHEQEKCRDRFICIEPGTAIDCCGHEIVVREEECIDIMQFEAIKALDKLQGEDRKKPHTLQIRICYRECPTEEIPVLYDECGCDDTKCAPNRILESYDFDVVVVDPSTAPSPGPRRPKDCKDILWDHLKECAHCDTPECILLATIEGYHIGDKIEDLLAKPDDAAKKIPRIDNKTRPLLPSTQTLLEYIECLGAKGGTGKDGDKGDPGPGLETGLTRIEALSWKHNEANNTIPGADSFLVKVERLDGPGTLGIIIGFTDDVEVSETIDANHVFQVLVESESPDDRNARRGIVCRCPIRGETIPVNLDLNADGTIKRNAGRIDSAKQSPPGQARGVAFLLDEGLPITQDILEGGIKELWVVLRGDFVKDKRNRAIDAEFVRAELPTGDRPAPPPAQPLKDQLGIQGGVFESWFQIRRREG